MYRGMLDYKANHTLMPFTPAQKSITEGSKSIND